jgi:hypothetical protein
MLTSTELNQLRADWVAEFADVAIVKNRTLTSNGRGGQVPTWTGTAEIACRFEFASGDVAASYSDQPSGGGVRPQQLYVVTTAHDAQVLQTDHLVISGQEYEVVTQLKTRSEMVTRRFLVKAV